MFESVLCTSFHAARDCGRLLNFTFRPTHTNIDVWPRDNWPAVTQKADRQKICYHASLTSSEIDSDKHKIFSQYVCVSLPGAPIVLQPTLDFERWWMNVRMQIPMKNNINIAGKHIELYEKI